MSVLEAKDKIRTEDDLTEVEWDIRRRAEADLNFFITLVDPYQVMGSCHKEVIDWWTRPDASHHQLLLFPRDHGKSRLLAFRCAHRLTVEPTTRILYISATSTLAIKQLGFIKNVLTSKIYQRYWPEHINPIEGRRNLWREHEIALDHPERSEKNIRDPSVFTAGLSTTIVGLHFDIAALDDIVINDNAYTKEGRQKVASQYSLLASIEAADSEEWVVGTRYHGDDLYNSMLDMVETVFDDDGEEVGTKHIYEVFERPVEDVGDGTGEFLFPRTKGRDGKWHGFTRQVLATKRGKYLDKGQFRAQYYNDPSDPDNQPIKESAFQYFEPSFLRNAGGRWTYNGKALNIVASIDFAYSKRKRADYTAIAVVGLSEDGFYYVLDLVRFKTGDISEYYAEILKIYGKWGFRKLIAEVTAAQEAIVRSLRKDYLIPNGVSLTIEEVRPTKSSKEERLAAILEPRYEGQLVFHSRSGTTGLLEEELITRNPSHDDLKDALASAMDKLIRPSPTHSSNSQQTRGNVVGFNSRFGGRQ